MISKWAIKEEEIYKQKAFQMALLHLFYFK